MSRHSNGILYLGFILILGVFVLTFARPHLKKIEIASWFQRSANENTGPISIQNAVEQDNDLPEISSADLAKSLSSFSPEYVLDIRQNGDFKKEHIARSINIPAQSFASNSNVQSLPKISEGQSVTIVGYGADEEDVRLVAKIIDAMGLPYRVLEGGFTKWKKEGGGVITDGSPSDTGNLFKVTFITQEELRELSSDPLLPVEIIDVSSPQSYQKKTIPGAKNIPFDELEWRSGEIGSAGTVIVVADSDTLAFQGGVRMFEIGVIHARILDEPTASWSE